MSKDKKHFYLKLNPPRPTFVMDMTDEEKGIMQKHVAYWTSLLNDGIAIVYDPVFDPKGGYGVGVISVDNDEHVIQLIESDPANGLNTYEYFPMSAVYQ